MRPFCVKCLRQMRPTKNDRAVATVDAIYLGDEYTCDCGAKIVTSFGEHPAARRRMAIHYNSVMFAEERDGNLLVEKA